MDYAAYRKKYFTEPPPNPRFDIVDANYICIYFEKYKEAVDYYTLVFGPPGYVEGDDTRGWRLGDTWLSLFPGRSGNPRNMSFSIQTSSPGEAENLQAAFIEAGGKGPAPSDEIMFEPMRFCPVQDPFGTEILIYSPLS